jgi:hydrogenase nickel incorporation protein HypA/HybF
MHEFSLIKEIVDTVIEKAKEHNAKKVVEIELEVGELRFLTDEQAQLLFEELSKGTILEGAKLKIKFLSSEIHCEECGYKGKVGNLQEIDPHLPIIKCPKCGAELVSIVRGNECIVKNIQIEK